MAIQLFVEKRVFLTQGKQPRNSQEAGAVAPPDLPDGETESEAV